MLTPLAAECFPGSCGGSVDHNMKPITAVTLLFLSEQHPDTGAADSFRAANHLTTGLGVAHEHHTSSRHLVDPEENPKGAMLRGGGALPTPACAPPRGPGTIRSPTAPPLLPRVHQSRTSALSRSLSRAHTGSPSGTSI